MRHIWQAVALALRGAGWVGTPRRLESWVLGARDGLVAHHSARG